MGLKRTASTAFNDAISIMQCDGILYKPWVGIQAQTCLQLSALRLEKSQGTHLELGDGLYDCRSCRKQPQESRAQERHAVERLGDELGGVSARPDTLEGGPLAF